MYWINFAVNALGWLVLAAIACAVTECQIGRWLDRRRDRKEKLAEYGGLYRMRSEVETIHRWCAEFGIVDEVTTRILAAGTPDPMRESIDTFRERLRQAYPLANAKEITRDEPAK